MSRGKYSPARTNWSDNYEYKYNCHGQIPPAIENLKAGEYDEKIHFGNYDENGFDRYGYSAFDLSGNYVGVGSGVDPIGITESEYLCMSDEQFYDYC